MPPKKRVRKAKPAAPDDDFTIFDAEVLSSEGEESASASSSPKPGGSPLTPPVVRGGKLQGKLLRGESFVEEYSGAGSAELQRQMHRLATMNKLKTGGLIPSAAAADASDKLLVVFDIDETLIYSRDGPLVMRPHAKELLIMCGEKCELAFWTAGTRDYAKAVLVEINKAVWGHSPAGMVRHLITRHKKWFNAADYTKDLLKLGRPLDKVLIIENTPDCVRLNPENAIIVEDFEGESEGQPTLKVLHQVIEALVKSGEPVSTFVKKCPQLEKQTVKGQDATVQVFYLKAGKNAVKEVKENRDRAAGAAAAAEAAAEAAADAKQPASGQGTPKAGSPTPGTPQPGSPKEGSPKEGSPKEGSPKEGSPKGGAKRKRSQTPP